MFPYEIKEIEAKDLEELNKKIREEFSSTESIISIQRTSSGISLFYLDYNYQE